MDTQMQQSPPVDSQDSPISENPPPPKSGYGKKNWKKWVLIYLIIGAVIYAGIYYFVLSKQGANPYSKNYPTPTIAPTMVQDETVYTEASRSANWKTYNENHIYFQYPSTWKENPLQPSGSGFTQEIVDPNGLYTLTFMERGNYNNGTGKAFTSLYEYAGLSYVVKTVTVDGQEAIQPLPRAGSENDNAIYVFSKDLKNIITLELTTHSSSVAEIKEGQNIFAQILSTFKFIDQEQQSISQCEFGRYKGVGCETGYKCFQGVDKVCGPGDNCSEARQIGDNMCHRVCVSNADCPSGFTCESKVAYTGDIQWINDKLCVKE